MRLDLTSVEHQVLALAQKINAPAKLLPTFGYSEDFARPHIEIRWCRYHYVVVERGRVTTRRKTSDFRELLYWIFQSVTFDMAVNYELENRILTQDTRRLWFAKQVELIGMIDPHFAARLAHEQQETLKEHPFDDEANSLSKYFR